MAVGGRLAVNGPEQVEHLDDALGAQVEVLAHQGGNTVIIDGAGAKGIHHQTHGLGNADGVGHLHFAAFGQAGGNDVLGHIAAGIGRRAIHLGRVLAGEGAAAVAALAAVGVNDDLAPGQAAVAHGPADDKAPGGVDEVFGVLVQHFPGQDRGDDLLADGGHQVFIADIGAVLGGEHHGIDGHRPAALVAHRDLTLGVGAQPGQAAVLAHHGLAFGEAVGIVDGRGHEDVGFVASIAEHEALIAGALVQIDATAFIHPLGDVRRLFVEGLHHGAGGPVETHLGGIVADAPHGLPRHVGIVHLRRGGDLPRQDDEARGDQGLRRHPSTRILGQDGIQDGIGDLVGDLVGMTFGDGFGGEQVVSGHS